MFLLVSRRRVVVLNIFFAPVLSFPLLLLKRGGDPTAKGGEEGWKERESHLDYIGLLFPSLSTTSLSYYSKLVKDSPRETYS